MAAAIDRLAPAVRRFAALGLALAAIAGLATLGSPVVRHIDGLRDRIETERRLLGRLTVLAAEAAGAKEAERRIASVMASGAFLAGETQSLQLAGLQALLKEIAAAQEIRFESTRTLPLLQRDALQLLGVQVTFPAAIEPLQRLLIAIEQNSRLLLVEALEIEPMPASGAHAEGEDRLLQAGMRIYGVIEPRRGERSP